MANNLPKYWCVKNDGSRLFLDTVIIYLNKIDSNWNGRNVDAFYGFDGNESFNGTNTHSRVDRFNKNTILLSLQEFINLSKETNMKYKQGDILIQKVDSSKCKILGICGEAYILSQYNTFDKVSGSMYTQQELDNYQWSLFTEPAPPIDVFVTLEEIAKWKGVEVEQIKIKQ